jgi:hypothetical protein
MRALHGASALASWRLDIILYKNVQAIQTSWSVMDILLEQFR